MSTNRKINLAVLMAATVLLALLAGRPALAGSKPKPPTTGTVQFKSSTYSVAENGGSVRIYVSRTGGSSGPASVGYATANGTATAGTDYTSKSGTLNWSGGDAADKYFDVTILNDGVYEGDETFKANLSGASGATLGSPSTATVTITDNETPAPAPAYTLQELKVPAGFTASRGYDVNDLGQVAGAVVTGTGGTYAAVWQAASETAIVLGNGSTKAINNSGQVAGSCMWADVEHPVVWIPDGQGGYEMIDLSGGAAVGSGCARDINDSGVVVGSFYDAASATGFVVVPEDTDHDGAPDTWFRDDNGDGVNDLMFTFQVSTETLWTEGFAINDMGWVVGQCDVFEPDYSGFFVIIPDYTLPNPWFDDENNDGLNDLATLLLNGGYSWCKMGVNNQGQVVVSRTRLFEVAEDGSFTTTVLPPPSSAYRWLDLDVDINDNGQVVGTGELSKPNASREPFLWQKEKGTMRLRSLVSDMAGFSDLAEGNGINNHGQIVGNGTTSAGTRGFLATPVPSGK